MTKLHLIQHQILHDIKYIHYKLKWLFQCDQNRIGDWMVKLSMNGPLLNNPNKSINTCMQDIHKKSTDDSKQPFDEWNQFKVDINYSQANTQLPLLLWTQQCIYPSRIQNQLIRIKIRNTPLASIISMCVISIRILLK